MCVTESFDGRRALGPSLPPPSYPPQILDAVEELRSRLAVLEELVKAKDAEMLEREKTFFLFRMKAIANSHSGDAPF